MCHITPQTLWFGTQIPADQLEPEDMEEASDVESSTYDEGNAKEDPGLPDFSGLDPVCPNPMEIQTTSQKRGLKVPLKKLPPVSGLLNSRLLLSPLGWAHLALFQSWKYIPLSMLQSQESFRDQSKDYESPVNEYDDSTSNLESAHCHVCEKHWRVGIFCPWLGLDGCKPKNDFYSQNGFKKHMESCHGTKLEAETFGTPSK